MREKTTEAAFVYYKFSEETSEDRKERFCVLDMRKLKYRFKKVKF